MTSCPRCHTSTSTPADLHAATREAQAVRMVDGPGVSLNLAMERVFALTAQMGQRIACAECHHLEVRR